MSQAVSPSTFATAALLERTCSVRSMFDARRSPGEYRRSSSYEGMLAAPAQSPADAAYRVADLLTTTDTVGPQAESLVSDFCDVIDALLSPECDPIAAAAQIDALALMADHAGFGVRQLEASARDLRAMGARQLELA